MPTQIRTKQLLIDADLSFNSNRLTNLANPSSDSDAATKAYTDSVAQGLDVKDAAKACEVNRISLNPTIVADSEAYHPIEGTGLRAAVMSIDVPSPGDTGGDKDGTFWVFYATPTEGYYVWYTSGAGDPTPTPPNTGVTFTGIQVSFSNGASETTLASATKSAIDGASVAGGNPNIVVSSNQLTLTNALGGEAPDVVEGSSATGFTFATDVAGRYGRGTVTAVLGFSNVYQVDAITMVDGDRILVHGEDQGTGAAITAHSVTVVAEGGGLTNNAYWVFYSTPNQANYVWYNVNAGGTDPTPSAPRGVTYAGIEVAVATAATAGDVASATHSAINAAYSAGSIIGGAQSSTSANPLTISNIRPGVVPGAADGADPTTFTLGTSSAGVGLGATVHGVWTALIAGTALTLTRAVDFDDFVLGAEDASEVSQGSFVFCAEGTAGGGNGYLVNNADPILVGSANGKPLDFTQFSGAGVLTGGPGIDISGNLVSVDLSANSGLAFNTTQLEVNAGTGLELSATTVRIAAAAAGDGLTGGGGSALEIERDTTTGGGVPGLSVGANGVGISTTAAGSGLTGGGGSALAVGAGTGITVNADDVAIDTTSAVTFLDDAATDWRFPVGTTAQGLFVTGTPVDDTHAVNKAYVDVKVTTIPPVTGKNYVGNALTIGFQEDDQSIAQINALSPDTGDAYVLNGAGTPTAGASDPLVAGSIAEFDGTSWKELVEGSGGFVPAGTVVLRASLSQGVFPILALFDGTTLFSDDEFPLKGQVFVISPGSVNGGDVLELDIGTPIEDSPNWVWNTLATGVGGFPPNGTRLLVHEETATLLAPLTDGADESNLVTFDGTSESPSTNVETFDGDTTIIRPSSSQFHERSFRNASGTWPRTNLTLLREADEVVAESDRVLGDSGDWENSFPGSYVLLTSQDTGSENGLWRVNKDLSASRPPEWATGMNFRNLKVYINDDSDPTVWFPGNSNDPQHRVVDTDDPQFRQAALGLSQSGSGLEFSGGLRLDPDSSLAFSAASDWVFPVNTAGKGLSVTGTPVDGDHVTNKTYVDVAIAAATDTSLLGAFDGKNLTANGNIAVINGLTPEQGDTFVTFQAGTPAAGNSDTLTSGAVAEFDGVSWKEIVAGVGGFPPAGTRILVKTQPATLQGVLGAGDEGKIGIYDGTSITPTLSSPSNGDSTVVKGEGSVFENKGFIFDGVVPTGVWRQYTDVGGTRQPVNAKNYIGNSTVATVNGLSPTSGDVYVMTDAGTITLGSISSAIGDVVEYSGTVWVRLLAGVNGGPPFETRLIVHQETITLTSPLGDGVDEGRIAVFAGSTLTPTFEHPADGDTLLVKSGVADSVFNHRGYIYRGIAPTGTWTQYTGSDLAAGSGIDITNDVVSVEADVTTGGNVKPVSVVAGGVGLDLSTLDGEGLVADAGNLRVRWTKDILSSGVSGAAVTNFTLDAGAGALSVGGNLEGTEMVSLNGQIQLAGIDYNVHPSGANINMASGVDVDGGETLVIYFFDNS